MWLIRCGTESKRLPSFVSQQMVIVVPMDFPERAGNDTAHLLFDADTVLAIGCGNKRGWQTRRLYLCQ